MNIENGTVLVDCALKNEHSTNHAISNLLLDSSLIVTTNKQKYDLKIIKCGDYIQIYSFPNKREITDKSLEKIKKEKNIILIDTDNLHKVNNIEENKDFKENKIELKNIIRSKLQCQRLAKANAEYWKTFITLTFADNIININKANKQLRYFLDKIKRIERSFKYLGVPEFQKRGAVHYHIFTNIDISDNRFIFKQIDNDKFKHIKYWNNGFTKVDIVNEDIKKVVGYISKYMTKDIDDRLYSHHRYFYSKNLIKPITTYLDLSKEKDQNIIQSILNSKSLIYENSYQSSYTQDLITFREYL